jgi:hypothetical protein
MKPFQAKVILHNYLYGTFTVNIDTVHVAIQIHLLKFT